MANAATPSLSVVITENLFVYSHVHLRATRLEPYLVGLHGEMYALVTCSPFPLSHSPARISCRCAAAAPAPTMVWMTCGRASIRM